MILNLPRLSAKNLHFFTTLIFLFFIFGSASFMEASAQNCPGNKLANPGFESGTSGWTIVSGTAVASSDANTGSGSIVIGGTNGFNTVNQPFAAIPNTSYTLRAYAKRDAGSGNNRPQIAIRVFNSSWQQITSRFEDIRNTNYELKTLNIKTPANAAFVAVQLSFATNNATQKLWVDDGCFIQESNNNNCSISAQAVNLNCDNKGTLINQLDDEWTADITVSGSNTASGWRRTNSGFNFDHGLYNTPFTTESFRITEGSKDFKFTDLGNENCEVTITVAPPPTCSNSGSGCDIDLALTAPLCNNNGTPNNPLDDTYTFEATVTGTNIGSGWNSTGTGFLSTFSGNYNTPTTIGPINVYNSSTTNFGVGDNASNSPCFDNKAINGPLACSTGNPNVCPGSLLQNGGFSNGLNGWQRFPANSNLMTVVSGGSFGQGVQVCNDTQNGVNLSYLFQEFAVTPGAGKEGLVTWNYKRVSGNGSAHVRLYFEDAAGNSLFSQGLNPGFQDDWNTFSFSRGIPDNATKVIVAYGMNQGAPTSTGCVIFDELCFQVIGGTTPTCSLATNVNVTACDDRNTPDPSDDMYNFVVDVTPTNGGTGYTAEWFEDGARRVFDRTYPVGIGQQFNRISLGTLTLTLTDNADPTCQTTVAVVPPAPCSGGTGGNGGDLKLTATGTPAIIGAWSFGSSTFTVRNEGTQAVSGVQISFDLHASAKLKGGDEYTTTQGTLESFWTQVPIWNVGSIAPGQSAMIQLNIFTLSGGEMPIYGQVSAASGNDPDSSPNNGTSPTPNEDDEAVFVFNRSGSPNLQPDLRLSNLSISNQPGAGQVLNYNFNVINSGSAAASGNYNIRAYISTDNVLSNDDIQDGIVPTGNTTVGTIPSVPGASTLPGNLPQGNYYLILKIDADNQITESNEGNNTVAVPFTIGGNVALPDLVVQNVTSRTGSQVFIGQSVSAYFDGVIIGGPLPGSNFPIIYSLYMSSNRTLDGNDYKILDLGLGFGDMIQFGGQVPPNLAPGNYYLIVEIDSPNNIAESNEGNNWAASTQTVEAVPVGNSCAFVKTYDTNGFALPNASGDFSLTETGTGYRIESIIRTQFNPPVVVNRTYQLDLNGNVQNLYETPVTFPDPKVTLEVDVNENVEMVFGNGSALPVGTRVPININSPNATNVSAPSAAYETASGEYVFGLFIVESQGQGFKRVVVKTNNVGQNVRLIELPNGADYYSGFSPYLEGSDGTIYFRVSMSGNYSLIGVPSNGTAWAFRVASDTPSSTWVDTKLTADGNYAYTLKSDNQQTFVSKINSQTGTSESIDLSVLKQYSPGGSYRLNWGQGLELTDDGGFLLTMTFSEATGNPRLIGDIIAKYNAVGALLWYHELTSPQYDLSLAPVGETSDGGALFVGRNGRGTNDTSDDAAIFIKTTDVGALNPICVGGSTDGVDLELSFAPLADPNPAQWGFFGVTLTVTNNGTEAATGVVVNFNKADQVTYRGGDEFSASQGDFQYWGNENWSVGNLAAGDSETLTVNYFRLSANPFTAFAEISAMNEADTDSAPGNGTCCTATEDDEAAVAIGSGSARSVGGRTLLEENISAREGFAILNAAPNPFSDQMTLNVYSHESQSSEVVIYDVLGRPVLRQAVDLTEGHNSISIDVSDLPVGFLTVKMSRKLSGEHRYLRQVRVVKVGE